MAHFCAVKKWDIVSLFALFCLPLCRSVFTEVVLRGHGFSR